MRVKGMLEHCISWTYYHIQRDEDHPQRKEVGEFLDPQNVPVALRSGAARFRFWRDLKPPFQVVQVTRAEHALGKWKDAVKDEAAKPHPDGDLFYVTYECNLAHHVERAWGLKTAAGTFDNKVHGVASVRRGMRSNKQLVGHGAVGLCLVSAYLWRGFCTYILHKPAGVVSQRRDALGRDSVYEVFDSLVARGLLPDAPAHVGAVGRLDLETTGLIVMTEDRELNRGLGKAALEKRYEITVLGHWQPADERIRGLSDPYLYHQKATNSGQKTWTKPAQVRLLRQWEEDPGSQKPAFLGHRSLLEFTLREGRNRQIRRLVARSGLRLLHLHRTAVGPLELRDTACGHARPVCGEELRSLRRLCGLE
ncbi:unnamed protein product [Effrenium voratum]|uniref:Pseudouridine synthase RsuA/RluA-like domain-containing protein n=1 Tax=Effrenium voratum TaxID=2562239 RepID=A0AA36HJX1_9DINO|nr:unnamed protein product [Effrenium voratum]